LLLNQKNGKGASTSKNAKEMLKHKNAAKLKMKLKKLELELPKAIEIYRL